MAHQTRVRTTGEEYTKEYSKEYSKEQEDTNTPRGINRLSSRTCLASTWSTFYQLISVVADLLQNESVTSLVQKRKEKQGEDSGLESGHTSMNTGKYHDLWTGGGNQCSPHDVEDRNTPIPPMGSLWHKRAYNRTFPCMEANYP